VLSCVLEGQDQPGSSGGTPYSSGVVNPVENTNLALAGAAFHSEKNCTGEGVAKMRPLSIRVFADKMIEVITAMKAFLQM
jgi:hypothetical protein